MSYRALFSLCFTAWFMAPVGASALTYVPVPDTLLVDRADAVVRATVVSRSVDDETGRVMTSYEFDITEVLRGKGLGSRLIVKVLGGIDLAKGLGVKVFGTPEFDPGDSTLLFLSTAQDGSYRVLHIFQGAFIERRSGAQRTYERPGTDRFEVATSNVEPGAGSDSARMTIQLAAPMPRDADLFEQWISDRQAGVIRSADYLLPESSRDVTVIASPFTYLAGDDFILRWFEFDSGRKVRWHRHKDGQAGFSSKGAQEFKKARKAWKRKFSGVPIKLTNAGTTSSTTGFDIADSRNTLLHRDFNDSIEEDFECPGGGVLAIGGLSDFDFFFTQWKGLSTLAAHEAEIVVNDGIDCFVQGNSDLMAQIYAHELGHTLGLGHACGDPSSPKCSKSDFLAEALMAARLDQPFGAEIHDDDILAARQLYDEDFWAAACDQKAPGAKSFCSKCGPCGEGQGNCKKDGDCFGTLVCTRDVGVDFGFDADVNVCTAP